MYKMVHVEGFDWDEGNREKSWLKHHVSVKEAEEVFFNKPRILWKDETHSGREERYIMLGRANSGRELYVVYTVRNQRIRVISVRNQNLKERRFYAIQK